MLSAVLSIAALPTANVPLPPYHRVHTMLLAGARDQTPAAEDGNLFFFAAPQMCRALDLRTMRTVWTSPLPKGSYAMRVDVAGGDVFVSSEGGQMGAYRLIALDEKSGRKRWSLAGAGMPGAVTRYGSTVYAGLSRHTLSAIDAQSHRTKWTTNLPRDKEGDSGGELDAVIATGSGIAVNCDGETRGINAKAGKIVWSKSNSYTLSRPLTEKSGIVWVPVNNGSAGVDIKTGHEIWTSSAAPGEFGSVFEGRFVGLGGGAVTALYPKTGHTAWTVRVGNNQTSGGNQYGAIIGGLLFARGLETAVVLNGMGKLLWSAPSTASLPPPIFSDGNRLVCLTDGRLLEYKHGAPPPLPTGAAARQAVANAMATHFDELDDEEVQRLGKLGDDAFEPVFAAFLKACSAYDAKGDNASMALYGKYHALAKVLERVTTPKRTPEMLLALDHIKGNGSAKPFLLGLLAQNGDPNIIAPYFVKELETSKTPGFEMYESNTYVAREFVANSTAPAAVSFMLRQLKDPKADTTLREAAYDNLARTGGVEGLKAVLAERHHRKLLPPLAQRVAGGYLGAGEFGTVSKVLSEKKDATGRTWGLLQCGILGSAGDLWLAEKVDGKWINPLFSGVSLNGISRWVKNPPPEPKVGGKTAKELAAGAWFDILVNNAEIRRDSAGSGVTDLEKKRLGLDPSKKDADGDGDNDDPWPNAAPRALTDAEQLLAAVFEARYHFDGSQGPALFTAPWDMKPFEMEGRNGPTLWVPYGTKHDWSTPLEQCYEQGVAFIGFGEQNQNATGPDRVIRWNADRTEGSVTISTYYGGLNGTGYSATARKFGDTWVVVAMRMAYVS